MSPLKCKIMYTGEYIYIYTCVCLMLGIFSPCESVLLWGQMEHVNEMHPLQKQASGKNMRVCEWPRKLLDSPQTRTRRQQASSVYRSLPDRYHKGELWSNTGVATSWSVYETCTALIILHLAYTFRLKLHSLIAQICHYGELLLSTQLWFLPKCSSCSIS